MEAENHGRHAIVEHDGLADQRSGLPAQQIRSRLPPARQVRSGNQGRLKVLEQTITAPSAGKIDRVFCEVGEQVREGAELLVFVDQ
jgi:biotin carboxyl carrier protein